MVKTPRTRHSQSGREPVTIDLGPGDVSRVEDEAPADAEATPDAPKEDIGASITAQAEPDAATPSAGEPIVTEPAPAQAEPTTSTAEDSATPSAGRMPPSTDARTNPGARPEPAPAPPPPRPSRGSPWGAGIVGGVVALAAAGLLQYAGVLGTPGSATGSASIPASVETEIASLKSEIEALKSASGAPADLGRITGQVDGLSQALEQVKTDIASLKQSVEGGGAGDGAAVEALNTRIAEIESRVATLGSASGGATAQDLAALNERIASAESLAKAATDAGSDLAAKFGALEQSVSALSTKVDAQAGQPKIALAIAASALKSAIERGSPFQSEIETFAAIAPDAPGLADLRSYAEQGVATRADLVAETDAAAKAMIAAANPPPANAGFFDRLLSSAESLVSVRPIGAVEGAGVPETVARMEVALQAGDLAKAIAEFDTLPEAAKAAGAPFADKIRARLAAEQLADQAIAAAMQA